MFAEPIPFFQQYSDKGPTKRLHSPATSDTSCSVHLLSPKGSLLSLAATLAPFEEDQLSPGPEIPSTAADTRADTQAGSQADTRAETQASAKSSVSHLRVADTQASAKSSMSISRVGVLERERPSNPADTQASKNSSLSQSRVHINEHLPGYRQQWECE